jgi:hypothetical protein
VVQSLKKETNKMPAPKFRIVAKNKETKKSLQIGSCWDAPFAGAYNLSFGAKSFGDSPEVKLVGLQLSINGKTQTVTPDSHFINLYVNEPRPTEGSDMGDDGDGEDEDQF